MGRRIVREDRQQLLMLEKQQPTMIPRLRMLQALQANPALNLDQYAEMNGRSLPVVARWWDLYQEGGLQTLMDPRTTVQDVLTDSLTGFGREQNRVLSGLDFLGMNESEKVTFEAITGALEQTSLTPDPKKSAPFQVKTAIQLIERVKQVAGRVDGAGGDEQFRLYVTLIPEAVLILTNCQQFVGPRSPGGFHAGYEATFRQQGSTPNIQFTTRKSTDAEFRKSDRGADIDIDYEGVGSGNRVFGAIKHPLSTAEHFRASNSDVEHSNHYDEYKAKRGWKPLPRLENAPKMPNGKRR